MSNLEHEFLSSLYAAGPDKQESLLRRCKLEWFRVLGEEAGFISDFYARHGSLPSVDVVQKRFPKYKHAKADNPAAYYADELQSRYLYSVAKNMLGPLSMELHQGTLSGFDLVERIKSIAESLSGSDCSKHVNWADPMDRLDRYRRKSEDSGVYFRPPFPSLRQAVYRIVPGNLMTLFARPATGKTWLACLFALAAIQQGLRTAIYSPEMTESEICDRLDGIHMKLNWTLFSRGELPLPEALRYFNKVRKMNSSKKPSLLSIVGEDAASTSMKDLEEYLIDNRIQFAVIDAAHQLAADGKSETERVYNRCRAVKQMAKRRGLMLFQTVQEGRPEKGAKTQDRQAQWGDCYLQESDLYANFYGSPTSNNRMFDLKKARNGSLTQFEIKFEMNPVCIEECFDPTRGLIVDTYESRSPK